MNNDNSNSQSVFESLFNTSRHISGADPHYVNGTDPHNFWIERHPVTDTSQPDYYRVNYRDGIMSQIETSGNTTDYSELTRNQIEQTIRDLYFTNESTGNADIVDSNFRWQEFDRPEKENENEEEVVVREEIKNIDKVPGNIVFGRKTKK